MKKMVQAMYLKIEYHNGIMEDSKIIGALTTLLLLAILSLAIVQTIYGGMSVDDCAVPAIMSVAFGGLLTLKTSFSLTRLVKLGISDQVKYYNMIILVVEIAYLASIIAVFDHRDNGQCQHQSILRDVSCALLGIGVISFVLCLIRIVNQPPDGTGTGIESVV